MSGYDHPLLSRVLAADTPHFALIHRPESGAGGVDLLLGRAAVVPDEAGLGGLPLPAAGAPSRHELLALLPYRQIRERGFEFPDDGTPLVALEIHDQAVLPLEEVLRRLPQGPLRTTGGGFDIDDEQYAARAAQVLDEEIGRGEGANFVLQRSYITTVEDWSAATALSFFRRMLMGEPSAYWTFVVHLGDRTLIGATPERHISLAGGTAVMNPISGTYRYPASGPTLTGVLDFLADQKEADELYMVVDEELKMMGRVCADGGQVVGPYLKQMSRLAHTEYLIEGDSTLDVVDILRETMFAPTVVGSPLESACKVVKRYEPEGRGYYSGVAALIGRDDAGERSLDSAILIRTADVDRSGALRLSVGATLVRDSSPESEVAETRAKAAGLLAALEHEASAAAPVPDFAGHPAVRRALASRNATVGAFWLTDPQSRAETRPGLAGRHVLVLDAEDTFTAMAQHQLTALGLEVSIRRYDEPHDLSAYDVVIVGPGPGDPRSTDHPKIVAMRSATEQLLRSGTPFLSVCLGHQVLSTVLGLDIKRRPVPNQGVQVKIDFFGRPELVGFYNTFAAHSAEDSFPCPARPGTVRACRDGATGEIHSMTGPGFASVQFHPASILTQNATAILSDLLDAALAR
ncbi:anthranilate synthase family protein [Streptomyces sp. H34-S4]|uniref:anthranilate synthase family protein n=1 Tax=Streptomyces sp. H34-S4 TaxID=2996463 RepID=UPI00226FA44C|nr:anthranilate synthase family protein [Streptomyces sp. H34-S4]MCY0935123.1 anthranilate synthase family protein [Streptomyces sp. H34-S4]